VLVTFCCNRNTPLPLPGRILKDSTMGIVFLFGMLLVGAGVFMMDARNAFWLSPFIKDLPEVNHRVLYGVSFVGAYMAW